MLIAIPETVTVSSSLRGRFGGCFRLPPRCRRHAHHTRLPLPFSSVWSSG